MALTVLLVVFIAALEYLSGTEVDFSVIYLIPVLLAASISKSFGVYISLISATLAIVASHFMERQYSSPAYYIWDFISHAAIFLLAATLRSNLLASRRQERELAYTDPLTGAFNSRAFHEMTQAEIHRAVRYNRPLTMAYLDVDNFKMVNDTRGHSEGDALLRAIVAEIAKRARKTDVVSRLGGDEFAILLPETGQENALLAIRQIQESLSEETLKKNWPVTFSIGVLTLMGTEPTVDKMIESADALMYEAKQAGKNTLRYGYYNDASDGEQRGDQK